MTIRRDHQIWKAISEEEEDEWDRRWSKATDESFVHLVQLSTCCCCCNCCCWRAAGAGQPCLAIVVLYGAQRWGIWLDLDGQQWHPDCCWWSDPLWARAASKKKKIKETNVSNEFRESFFFFPFQNYLRETKSKYFQSYPRNPGQLLI